MAQRARRDSSLAARRRPGARPARRLGACGAPPRPFPPSIRRGGAIWPAQALAAACRGAHMGAGAAGRRSAGRGATQAAGRERRHGREAERPRLVGFDPAEAPTGSARGLAARPCRALPRRAPLPRVLAGSSLPRRGSVPLSRGGRRGLDGEAPEATKAIDERHALQRCWPRAAQQRGKMRERWR